MFDQLEQGRICVLTVISFGIVPLTVCHASTKTVVFLRNTRLFPTALTALTLNYTLPVTQPTSRVAYPPPLLCAVNAGTYTHHQTYMCVTLFAGAAVILWPCRQRLAMIMPFFG